MLGGNFDRSAGFAFVATLAVAAATLMWIQTAAAATASAEDAPASLTGVETAQSKALDERAQTLFQQYRELQGEHLESTQRGFALLGQIEKDMLDAARMRAHAAQEQRCVGAASAPNNGMADTTVSPFLCSAVRAGQTPAGPMAAWQVCSCAREYLSGLAGEIEEIQKRAAQFVGQKSAQGTIDAQAVSDGFFEPLGESSEPGASQPRPIGDISYEEAAQSTQISLAANHLDDMLGRPHRYPPPIATPLSGAVDGTTADLQRYIKILWQLHVSESRWRLSILETSVNEQQENRARQLTAESNATLTKIGPSLAGLSSYDMTKAQDKVDGQICGRANQQESVLVDITVEQVRSTITHLKDTRRRLVRDVMDWQSFLLSESRQTGSVPGSEEASRSGEDFADYTKKTFSPVEIKFAILSSTNGTQVYSKVGGNPGYEGWSGAPECRAFSYFLPAVIEDPEKAIPAVASAVQKRYPEAEVQPSQSGLELQLSYSAKGGKDIEEALASGAAAGVRP